LLALEVVEKVPGGQRVHCACPGSCACEPAGQSPHTDWPALGVAVPAMHMRQEGDCATGL